MKGAEIFHRLNEEHLTQATRGRAYSPRTILALALGLPRYFPAKKLSLRQTNKGCRNLS